MLYFDKDSLKSQVYDTEREILLTNSQGGYTSTTLCGCNTRKYHGLVVSPIEKFDWRRHVLLATMIEQVEINGHIIELSTIAADNHNSNGAQYISDSEYFPIPTTTFECEQFTLKKEVLKFHNQDTLMIRYTLLRADNHITLRLKPLMAFRDAHKLTHQNIFADTSYHPIVGGAKCSPYPDFPWLYMQTDIKSEYHYAPFWLNGVNYECERQRGYQWLEDLLCNGHFDIRLYYGESAIFSCSTSEIEVSLIEQCFAYELKQKRNNSDFIGCLRYSAEQFIVKRHNECEIIAGWHWFDSWGRDTFISLPGLMMWRDDIQPYLDILDTMVAKLHNGLFPNTGESYNSVDAPLWFFHSLQQLDTRLDSPSIWRRYSRAMMQIIEAYATGCPNGIVKMNDDGLIETQSAQLALTWQDAVVDGQPVTPRNGMAVEINALWYNAICYLMDKTELHREYPLMHRLKALAAKVKKSFLRYFWSDELGYLCDFVNANEKNTFIRPNMVIATSLPYTMLDNGQIESVLNIVREKLLTPKGLRSLSPDNPLYCGHYVGDQTQRDRAYHNGTVWVWLLEHYVRARFRLEGAEFIPEARQIIHNFLPDIDSYGIATLAEIYDGDAPHLQRGAISQAWSVAAILEIQRMIENNQR